MTSIPNLKSTTSLKILVVEDNVTDLKLVHSVLARAGHDVRDARSAEEAVEILERDSMQVILTDLKLPLMDGFLFTRQVKQSAKTSTIPVIAMSSYAENYSTRKLREAGFAAYLSKPLNTRTLCRQIFEALEAAY